MGRSLPGHITTEETKRKIGLANMKSNAGYSAIHFWVRKYFEKSNVCEHCKNVFKTNRQIHWANKSGLYSRERTDWLRLCGPCHHTFDNKKRGGVSYSKQRNKWRATLMVRGKLVLCKRFVTKEEADRAIQVAKKDHIISGVVSRTV